VTKKRGRENERRDNTHTHTHTHTHTLTKNGIEILELKRICRFFFSKNNRCLKENSHNETNSFILAGAFKQ
jgi:hypothetical protein